MSTIQDDYRRLLRELRASPAREVLRSVEEAVWFGTPGAPSSPSILERELGEARERGVATRRRLSACAPELLILPVGYSPEPLLLSAAYHAPRTILLLVEQTLEKPYLVELGRLWNACHDALGGRTFEEVEQGLVRDSPEAVFQAVRDAVEERPGLPRERIVVDVTGSKKSMIGGAFLAAAHLGISTAYVDFEVYDPILRRPFPGALRPGKLRDPYRLFQLREARDLGRALDMRRFEEAEHLAEKLAQVATDPEVQDSLGDDRAKAEAERFQALGRISAAYRLWSDGFYADALEALRECAGLPAAPTLEVLGKRWPHQSDREKEIVEALDESRIFEDPVVPLAYFADVLIWWDEERTRRQPREAYVRLYGTIESLMSFLFHAHAGPDLEGIRIEAETGAEVEELLEGLSRLAPSTRGGEPIDWPADLRRSVRAIAFKQSTRAIRLLQGKQVDLEGQLPPGLKLPKGGPKEKIEAAIGRFRARLTKPALPKELASRFFHFNELRHKTAHWLAPIPRDLAQELRAYLCTIILEQVPEAVTRLRGTCPSTKDLEAWCERLAEVARGSVPEDCKPLLNQEIEARVLPVRGGTEPIDQAGGSSEGET